MVIDTKNKIKTITIFFSNPSLQLDLPTLDLATSWSRGFNNHLWTFSVDLWRDRKPSPRSNDLWALHGLMGNAQRLFWAVQISRSPLVVTINCLPFGEYLRSKLFYETKRRVGLAFLDSESSEEPVDCPGNCLLFFEYIQCIRNRKCWKLRKQQPFLIGLWNYIIPLHMLTFQRLTTGMGVFTEEGWGDSAALPKIPGKLKAF